MWSATIRIGRVNGISIELHATFILVVLWGAWQGVSILGGIRGGLIGITTILLLFLAVLLHELGHGLMAQKLGLYVYQIVLMPIGGFAKVETSHTDPWQELLYTAAGPIANLIMAAGFGVIAFTLQPFSFGLLGGLTEIYFDPGLNTALRFVFWVNITLFIFNMIPAFPIDGGRILRAALALFLDYTQATRFAVWIGYLFAFITLASALAGIGWDGDINPLLILLALMMLIGVRHEDVYLRQKQALLQFTVDSISMSPKFSVAPSDSLSRQLVRGILRGEEVLPVVKGGEIVGLLSYNDVVRARSRLKTVAHAMRTDFPVLLPTDTLWVAAREMEISGLTVLPVRNGELLNQLATLRDVAASWK